MYICRILLIQLIGWDIEINACLVLSGSGWERGGNVSAVVRWYCDIDWSTRSHQRLRRPSPSRTLDSHSTGRSDAVLFLIAVFQLQFQFNFSACRRPVAVCRPSQAENVSASIRPPDIVCQKALCFTPEQFFLYFLSIHRAKHAAAQWMAIIEGSPKMAQFFCRPTP